jgi:hypothetical protein
MRRSNNGVIGVGHWVESNTGAWHRLDPRDPWSWFMHPLLTLQELLEEVLP